MAGGQSPDGFELVLSYHLGMSSGCTAAPEPLGTAFGGLGFQWLQQNVEF